uniref:EGF-like domain-containing protein n=1 Tax=Odontella aurita TaxID=265563 RepID=A0A7S4KC84_9STRA
MALPQDMYSCIYHAPPVSSTFVLAVVTFLFQVTILVLLFLDEIGLYDKEFQFDGTGIVFPAGVPPTVRASQFLAILVSVATQDDLITAIDGWHMGYSSAERNGGNRGRAGGGGAAAWQWILSQVLRGLEGALCLLNTFLLIFQEDNVQDIFMDFLAVQFVTGLDDTAFFLGRNGYFGSSVRRGTRAATRVRLPRRHDDQWWFRPLVFALVSAGLLAGWGVVGRKQSRGGYLSCRNVFFQFGDIFHAELGFVSGVFLFQDMDRSNRPIYVSPGYKIAFCNLEDSWTLSRTFAVEEGEPDPDPCNSWIAIASGRDEYDILDISPRDWNVYWKKPDGSKRAKPFTHVAVRCNGCDDPAEGGSCDTGGTCVDNVCFCHSGWYGQNCQFRNPCEEYEVSTDLEGWWQPDEWAGTYKIVAPLEEAVVVHERPVYLNKRSDTYDRVIVFTGRRWFFTALPSIENATTKGEMLKWNIQHDALKTNWINVTPAMISSPVDVSTPSDLPDLNIALTWYHPYAYNAGQRSRFADSNLALTQTKAVCTFCNNASRPCANGGTCAPNGRCACDGKTYGSRCQITSVDVCTGFSISLVNSSSGYVGGRYDLGDDTIGYRPVFVASAAEGGSIAYCLQGEHWALLLGLGSEDPCSDWHSKSSRTSAYDVLTSRNWSTRRADGNESNLLPIASSARMTCNTYESEGDIIT